MLGTRLGKGEKIVIGSDLVKQIVSQVGLKKKNSKFLDGRKFKRNFYLRIQIRAQIFFMSNTITYMV